MLFLFLLLCFKFISRFSSEPIFQISSSSLKHSCSQKHIDPHSVVSSSFECLFHFFLFQDIHLMLSVVSFLLCLAFMSLSCLSMHITDFFTFCSLWTLFFRNILIRLSPSLVGCRLLDLIGFLFRIKPFQILNSCLKEFRHILIWTV